MGITCAACTCHTTQFGSRLIAVPSMLEGAHQAAMWRNVLCPPPHPACQQCKQRPCSADPLTELLCMQRLNVLLPGCIHGVQPCSLCFLGLGHSLHSRVVLLHAHLHMPPGVEGRLYAWA